MQLFLKEGRSIQTPQYSSLYVLNINIRYLLDIQSISDICYKDIQQFFIRFLTAQLFLKEGRSIQTPQYSSVYVLNINIGYFLDKLQIFIRFF